MNPHSRFGSGDFHIWSRGKEEKYNERKNEKGRTRAMLIYEYKLDGTQAQYAAIAEAIRVVQFIRNKALRLWMDVRGTGKNDLQCLCAQLANEYPFVRRLNSQARQASASRAWFAISRFYTNCKNHKPGKKGYPRFQHDNRSLEYKQTGWLRFVCPKTVKTGEGQQRKNASADNW